MLCEKCKKNKATVHIEQTINLVKTEKYLCEDCASFKNLMFSDDEVTLFNSKALSLVDKRTVGKLRAKFCPSCGMSLSEFYETSFLGCPQCYSSFMDELDNILESVQVRTKYIGKGLNNECNK